MKKGYYRVDVSIKNIEKMILNSEQMDERVKNLIAEPSTKRMLAVEYVALENEFWKLAKAYSELLTEVQNKDLKKKVS